jgi:predicted O-methyltransferase YrrM
MNKETLARLANQAALMPQMVADYPDPVNKNITFPPSPYYRFLRLLSESMQSRLSVELGVCGGGGSLHLATGSKQAIGVDYAWDHQDNINWIKKNYSNFTFLLGDSVAYAQYIYDKFGLIDLLFIDTTHTYEQTMAEYNAYKPFLSQHAVICLDDLFRQGMDKVWAEMPETKLRLDFLHPSQSPTDGGFGVIWK